MSEADASHAHAIQPTRFDRSGSARRSIGGESGPSYAPHSPEQTLLHRVVREQLEPFLARARARERPAPHFVEQELRAFVRCGILAHGFLRLRCDECGLDRLVPFSCKRRGFCPSCGGRRMADTAAHLVDRVLPAVPVRQWVLTLPYPLRFRCAYDRALTSEVLRAFLRSLFAELRRRVRRQWGVRAEQCGAVTFLQRFGSALNLNLHFHTLALDGAYSHPDEYGETPRFFALPPPCHDDVSRVLAGTARRIARRLESRAEEDEDALARDEPLLAALAAASLYTRITTGPQQGEPWRRFGDRVDPGPDDDPDASPRVPMCRGMSLHANVAVPARDRHRLERLCRYVARPPLANDRLEERPDGRLLLRLKTPWRDGTTHIAMEQSELIDRLVPLIPPPRAHQVRYHGILAPCASLRRGVVPVQEFDPALPATSDAAPEGAAGGNLPVQSQSDSDRTREDSETRPRRLRWAALLQRVFGLDALRCPRCGATLRVIAAIEDPAIARRILECIGLPARAPPIAAAASSNASLRSSEPRRELELRPDAVRRRSLTGATESEPPAPIPISVMIDPERETCAPEARPPRPSRAFRGWRAIHRRRRSLKSPATQDI
jgi:Putative transposase/Transposase zinc-binding domain